MKCPSREGRGGRRQVTYVVAVFWPKLVKQRVIRLKQWQTIQASECIITCRHPTISQTNVPKHHLKNLADSLPVVVAVPAHDQRCANKAEQETHRRGVNLSIKVEIKINGLMRIRKWYGTRATMEVMHLWSNERDISDKKTKFSDGKQGRKHDASTPTQRCFGR